MWRYRSLAAVLALLVLSGTADRAGASEIFPGPSPLSGLFSLGCPNCSLEMKQVCRTVYRPVLYSECEQRTVTRHQVKLERIYEPREAVCYRTVSETAYRERRYTVRKPVYETTEKQYRYKVRKPVWETRQRERVRIVRKPVYETVEHEQKYKEVRPVWETRYREKKETIYRTVWENAEREMSYSRREPVTQYRTVKTDSGHWEEQKVFHPGSVVTHYEREPAEWVYDPCTGRCFYRAGLCREVQIQQSGYHTTQRKWISNIVEKKVPYTRYVTRNYMKKVPVKIRRYVAETRVNRIPVRVCRMVEEERVRKVAVRTCRWIKEEQRTMVSERVCRMVEEEMVKKVPVKTRRYVDEEKVERVPYQVNKRVPYTVRYMTSRLVLRNVPETRVVQLRRPVLGWEPKTVCFTVPSMVRCPKHSPFEMVEPAELERPLFLPGEQTGEMQQEDTTRRGQQKEDSKEWVPANPKDAL